MLLSSLLAIALTVVFWALALLHVYWAFGGRWGSEDSVPSVEGKPMFEPGMWGTLVVAGLLGLAAYVCLARVGIASVGPPFVWRTGTWVLGGVLALRAVGDFRYVGFFKRIRDSRFARLDTALYSPLCAVIATGVIVLALTAE